MHQYRRYVITATSTLLLLATTLSTLSTQVTATAHRASSPSSTPTPSTCPFRRVNYITQSLPKQCLTAAWASKAPPHNETTIRAVTNAVGNKVELSSSDGVTTAAAGDSTVLNLLDASTYASVIADVHSSDNATKQPSSSLFPTPTKPSDTEPDVPESETNSPLDDANFLSFEEWKRQNLANAGQSADSLGATIDAGPEQRRRPGTINNALDSLGEDTEIDIEFGGFVNNGPMKEAPLLRGAQVQEKEPSVEGSATDRDAVKDGTGIRKRPKDAGRTCKERTNYASYDCAATTLKTNPECKSSSAVLVENKDSYMLNICSAQNKFFIVELCDNILIDTIVLANFEFFSSMFRTFRVSVSDKYPVKLERWRQIGTYEARNGREIQAFLVDNPLIWARYLRVEILTHYGNEYYCPVSLLRVHGTTMMEEFNSEMKRSGGDDESEGDSEDIVENENALYTPDVVVTETAKEHSETITEQRVETSSFDSLSEQSTFEDNGSRSPTSLQPSPMLSSFVLIDYTLNNSSASAQLAELFSSRVQMTSSQRVRPTSVNPPFAHTKSTSVETITPTTTTSRVSVKHESVANLNAKSTVTVSEKDRPSKSPTPSAQAVVSSSPNAIRNSSAIHAGVNNSTAASTIRTHTTSTQPPVSNPTTQESFFKSVHKRLQFLEANSTLSLQYIEEQSRILRDAFSKVEKRQLLKTSNFLENLNRTVLTELMEFRSQYDQIWQSTVLELSSQRQQSQQEVLALSTRLGLLADEIVFQKRMAILQFMLILLCITLVIFSRVGSSSSSSSTGATYLELPPLVQSAINKSSANLSRYAPLFDSPPLSPPASRPSSRYGLLRRFTHGRSPSEESYAPVSDRGPGIEYSPPTPESQHFDPGSMEASPGLGQGLGDVSDSPPSGVDEQMSM